MLILALQTVRGLSCECDRNEDVVSNWQHAAQVFIGVLVSADSSGHIYNQNGRSAYVFTLKIVESLKGQAAFNSRYYLRSFINTNSSMCRYGYFRAGRRYIVFAYNDRIAGFLSASSCGRTGPESSFSTAELQQLRKLGAEWQNAQQAKLRKRRDGKPLRVEDLTEPVGWSDSPELKHSKSVNELLQLRVQHLTWLASALGTLLGLTWGIALWRRGR